MIIGEEIKDPIKTALEGSPLAFYVGEGRYLEVVNARIYARYFTEFSKDAETFLAGLGFEDVKFDPNNADPNLTKIVEFQNQHVVYRVQMVTNIGLRLKEQDVFRQVGITSPSVSDYMLASFLMA